MLIKETHGLLLVSFRKRNWSTTFKIWQPYWHPCIKPWLLKLMETRLSISGHCTFCLSTSTLRLSITLKYLELNKSSFILIYSEFNKLCKDFTSIFLTDLELSLSTSLKSKILIQNYFILFVETGGT